VQDNLVITPGVMGEMLNLHNQICDVLVGLLQNFVKRENRYQFALVRNTPQCHFGLDLA